MHKFRKMITAVAVLIAMLPLASATMSVEWEWLLDDPDVTAYRYKIGNEEGWTTLSGDVDSIVIDGLDPEKAYTLYLQRSYDGVYWSETAVSTAEATVVEYIPHVVEEEKPEIVSPEPVIIEEESVAEEVLIAEEPEESAPEVVVVTEEGAVPVAEEKRSVADRFAFSLLPRFGVASTLDFDRILAEIGIGFDFAHIISAGDHFSLGLRSDLLCNFVPKQNGVWNLENNLDYFNVLNYAETTSLDLKLMLDVTAGVMDLYIGGGAGFAIGNPLDAPNVSDLLGGNVIHVGCVGFETDWFASGMAGVRFALGRVFSLGVEANYRYMVEAKKHVGSADIVLGFTF